MLPILLSLFIYPLTTHALLLITRLLIRGFVAPLNLIFEDIGAKEVIIIIAP